MSLDSANAASRIEDLIADLTNCKDIVEGNDTVEYPIEPLLTPVDEGVTELLSFLEENT